MILSYFYIFLVLFVVIGFVDGSAEILSFTCTPGPELCLNLHCNTTVNDNNNHQLNCGCFIPRPLYELTWEVWLERKRARKYVTLINLKEDLVKVVKSASSTPVMSNLFTVSRRFLTGFEYPFQGNLSVRKMPVLLNYAAVFMQSSIYKLLMEFRTQGEELILRTKLDFEIGSNKNRKKKTPNSIH